MRKILSINYFTAGWVFGQAFGVYMATGGEILHLDIILFGLLNLLFALYFTIKSP